LGMCLRLLTDVDGMSTIQAMSSWQAADLPLERGKSRPLLRQRGRVP
jgi:hypothetical protein